MGEIGRDIIYPIIEDIINLNHFHISTTGGFNGGENNLRYPDSLKWVLDAIQYPLFGIENYPTIAEKAAALAWIIIKGHVFFDGNKRTGISTLITFLLVNGYQLDASADELYEIAKSIASGEQEYFLNDFTAWIRKKLMVKISKP